MAQVIGLDPTAVPRRAMGCRRREKAGGRVYLIRFADVFLLDAVSSAVWDAIDGRASVVDVIASVCARTGRSYADSAEAVVGGIVILSGKGFLGIEREPGAWPDARGALAERLAPALDALNRSSPELAELAVESRARVVTRFVQICHEMASRLHDAYADEETYWHFLADGPPRAVDLHLTHELGFLRWRFRAERNQLSMVFEGSTYTGDVDHRQ